MSHLRILIVDDHEPTRQQLVTYLENQSSISLVMEAPNGLEALKMLQDIPFDAMVTDMIMPQMDGFTLIHHMQNSNLVSKPALFMMSSLNRSDFIAQASNLGALFFFIKPFAPENLFFHLQNLATPALCMPALCAPLSSTSQMMDERISTLFMGIGIPAHLKGYQCLRVAIKMVVDDPSLLDHITKGLYPAVAQNLCSASSKVERAMRHAIEVAWNRGRAEPFTEAFGQRVYIADDRPTNGEFIALVADKISLEMSNHTLYHS